MATISDQLARSLDLLREQIIAAEEFLRTLPQPGPDDESIFSDGDDLDENWVCFRPTGADEGDISTWRIVGSDEIPIIETPIIRRYSLARNIPSLIERHLEFQEKHEEFTAELPSQIETIAEEIKQKLKNV